MRRIFLLNLSEFSIDLIENILCWIFFNRTCPGNVALSRFHVELNVRNPRTILTTIVLFFHEEVHFINAIQRSTVFLQVVFHGFFKSQKSYSTLMFYRVTHGLLMFVAKIVIMC